MTTALPRSISSVTHRANERRRDPLEGRKATLEMMLAKSGRRSSPFSSIRSKA